MAEDGEVRVKITGDSKQITSEFSKVENTVNKDLGSALENLSSRLTDTADKLQETLNKSQNVFEPITKEAPQAAQALSDVEGSLDGLSEKLKETEETQKKSNETAVDYISKLEAINSSLNVLSSEMNAVTSAYSRNATSAESLAAIQSELAKQIELYKEKQTVLNAALANAEKELEAAKIKAAEMSAAYGENSNEAKKAAGAVHDAQIVVNEYTIQANNCTAAINKLKAKQEEAGDAAEKLGNTTEKAEDNINDLGDSAKKSESKFKSLGTVLKSLGVAAAAAAAAVGKAAVELGKEIVSSYADYEQLVGGVDTLFKNSSETVQQYAANAYKTAGMSANEYMKTVTGFSASLISSLGGDTQKAAEYADMAVTDMADNANKMGTDIESIQNAYQGFAKQNYTMLDNLKLGYGGTKEEMERLLADAEAISGIEYDIDSYADVVSAIHVIQESMDIAGTTAAEAEHTITGSIDTLKGAISNLVTGLGDADADIEQLCQNVAESFNNVVDNVTPVIENIISALPTAVNALLDAVSTMLPTIIQTAADLFSQVLNAILEMLPELIPAAVDAVILIANALIENASLLVDAAVQLISELASGLGESADELIPAAVDAVLAIAQGLLDNIDLLLDSAEKLIIGVADGLIDSIPKLIEAVPKIIWSLGEALVDCALTAFIDLPIRLMESVTDGLENFDFEETATKWVDDCVAAYNDAVDNCTERLTEIGNRISELMTAGMMNVFELATEIAYGESTKSGSSGGHGMDGGGSSGRREPKQTEDSYASSMARYYEQKGRQAEKEADALARLNAKNEELENKISDEFKAAYEELNMQQIYGEITEEEYYTKLGELLESYHAKGLSAYNKYYNEINTYREKQNKAALKEQEAADKEALKAKEKADKAALKQLTKSQKESISALKSSLNELAKTYQSKYNDILKQQESYASHLKSGLDIFQKEETDDKIIYSISNIKEYKKQVDEFTKSIQKLKDRNLNTDLLNEIMNMDMADGLVYSKNLLAMGDKEFNEINDTYNEVSKLIDDRSQELYSGELQAVNDSFVSDVRELFGGLPEEIKGIGLESAAGFVDGLDTSKETVISDITDYFDGIFDSVGDSIDSASAAVSNADDYVDAFTKELNDRSSDIYAAVSKLLENADAAAVIKTTVEAESSAAPAAVSGGVKTSQAASESKSGKTDKTDESKNQPLYLTLDGKIIAEYVINYANNKSRVTGGSVIK